MKLKSKFLTYLCVSILFNDNFVEFGYFSHFYYFMTIDFKDAIYLLFLNRYLSFYPVDSVPHIAIIDPRTGERVKVWNTSLTPAEFLLDGNNICLSFEQYLNFFMKFLFLF